MSPQYAANVFGACALAGFSLMAWVLFDPIGFDRFMAGAMRTRKTHGGRNG